MKTKIPPRLLWACRRGMLELDVLLGNFLTESYLSLSTEDQALFEQLLTCNDQELFEWLTGRTPVTDATFTILVKKIRDHAKNRHAH
ncbi:MAG: succinate dehydrogenase assembly factor 2 [Gammaproteobacteria bacterium]|nr:succinate dehydrogenase assembly factor 2 [Gammaproteobacteria bacterium]